MTLTCQVCGGSTSQIYCNIRVTQYYYEDCDLLYRVYVGPKFHADKPGLRMQLNASGKRFINRDMSKDHKYGVPVL